MENVGPIVLIACAVVAAMLLGVGYYTYRNRERTGIVNEVSRPKNGEDRTLYDVVLIDGKRSRLCYLAVFGQGPEDIRKGKKFKFKADWSYSIHTKYPSGYVERPGGSKREDTTYIYYYPIKEYTVVSDFS